MSTRAGSPSNALPEDHFRAPDDLLKAQALGELLDSAIRIPGIGLKVGLDFLVGLIPVIGDTLMLLMSLRIVHLGHKLGLPKALKVKIFRNVMLDYLLGFIPIIGDVVDLFFKANQRNVRIIEQYWVHENKEKIDALTKQKVDDWHRQQHQLDE